jgi:hypothetical protein
VQANLLSVGMRVRKAVPEGYKTGSYAAFALWDENSNNNAMQNGAGSDAGRLRANAFSAPRELMPFCGIHRVGGLGVQESSESPAVFGGSFSSSMTTTSAYPSFPGTHDVNGMGDIPGLTLSQESVDSNSSTSSGITGAQTRKRSFADEEDDAPEMPGRLSANAWQDEAVSPRSLVPVGWGNGRTMAVPRKIRLRGKPAATGAVGQENFMVIDDDFDEAPFLDPSLEVEMDDV